MKDWILYSSRGMSELRINWFLNIGGSRLLIDLLMSVALLIGILSWNLRTLLFKNNRLEWVFRD